MMCIVYHCKAYILSALQCYLICNNSQSIANSRDDIALRRWGRELNVPNLGYTEQSTVVMINFVIWGAVLIWLNGGFSSKVDCVELQRRFDAFNS